MGLENKMRPVRTGSIEKNDITAIQRSVSMTEEQISKSTDEAQKAELEDALIYLKTKLLKKELEESGFKKEESLGDFEPTLDDHLEKNTLGILRDEKRELYGAYKNITEGEKVSDYFKAETRIPELISEISHRKKLIEKGLEVDAKISKEKLDKDIEMLRETEKELENSEKYVSENLDNPEVKIALLKMQDIENKIKDIDSKMEKEVNLAESDKDKRSSSEITTSLN